MNERQAHILDLVTEGHIRSARPVPSSWIAEKLAISSATVRNEFGHLEESGYLQQPHASAGRIPTALSYTRYARKFIPPGRLPAGQQRLLVERLRGSHGDSLMQQIAGVTAELSGYAVVVSLPADDNLQALEIHLSALSHSRLLAVVVLENGLVRQLVVELEPTPSDATLREAESSLRPLTLPVGEVPLALVDLARRVTEDIARTYRALAEAWPGMNPPRFFSQGLRNLLSEPESNDPNFVRTALELLEGHLPSDAGPSHENGFAVVIGEVLAQVGAPLELGVGKGTLILLGPMRMRYPEALMIAQGVSDTVAERESLGLS
ncbi:MAG TPA: hypothetical protein VF171_00135 [Trueperaceae bacterium]